MPEIAAVQPTLVGDRADDRARHHPVRLADIDPVRSEFTVAGAPDAHPGRPLSPVARPALLRRRFRRHQELGAVARLQRQGRGDIGHRHVVVALVVPDHPAEQLDPLSAQRVGDRIAELRHPLLVDVVNGRQLGFYHFGPRVAFDRLEQGGVPAA